MSDTLQTPLGPLPKEWDYREIGPHVDLLTGPAFDSSRFDDNPVGTRLARGINVTKGYFRWDSDITKYWPRLTSDVEKYLLQENDVIIGMDGSLVGRNYALVSQDDVPSLLVQRVARLRTDNELDCRFLYYFIASDFWLAHVDVVKTHSGIPHISNGDIREFRIAFPPSPEQRKIARILTTLDNLIEKTETLIAKYQAIRQGVMHDLFTRGIDEHGHLRPPQTEAPHLYKQSQLGWIPKEWEVRQIGDLANYMNGHSFDAALWSRHGLPIIRIQNLNGEESFNYYGGSVDPSWEVLPGDLLFAWAGMLETSFGPRIWKGPRGVLNQHIFKVEPNTDLIRKEFLHLLLKHNLQRIVLCAHGFKSSFVHVTRAELLPVSVCLPPGNEQERIS